MNEQTRQLLEKALRISPDDWETRAHLVEASLDAGATERAAELLREAPSVPADEAAQLLKARVEMHHDPSLAILTLEALLAVHKASAPAYLLLARVYRQRGLKDEARRKYGAATIIDDSLRDPELEAWLGGPEAVAQSTRPEKASDADDQLAVAALLQEIEGEAESKSPELEVLPPPPHLPRVTFDEIGGMQEVIERVRMNIIYPFKNPEVFRKFNKRPGGGILMYGPPGCGKTHLARATAGECGARFISIGITDILSKWLGESERHLHEIFQTARQQAPAVIFIDEIDAIAMSRSDAGSYQAPLVNVLLTELDGIQGANENLMVLAATNVPWRVDSALRRPGRFDRVLFVPPPDLPAREAIFQIHLKNMPSRGVEVNKLARQCDGFSGADLRAVVERAAEKAIYQEMRTGKTTEITQALLQEALKETKASTAEWLETARSYATYANKAGLYDDLVAYFER